MYIPALHVLPCPILLQIDRDPHTARCRNVAVLCEMYESLQNLLATVPCHGSDFGKEPLDYTSPSILQPFILRPPDYKTTQVGPKVPLCVLNDRILRPPAI